MFLFLVLFDILNIFYAWDGGQTFSNFQFSPNFNIFFEYFAQIVLNQFKPTSAMSLV